jgi:high-affinity nickel-transport protein
MILVLGTIPSAVAGLVYIAVFGIGSTGGMLLMSSLISLPFVWTAGRARLLTQSLQMMVGCGSMAFGCFLAWQYGLQHLALPR